MLVNKVIAFIFVSFIFCRIVCMEQYHVKRTIEELEIDMEVVDINQVKKQKNNFEIILGTSDKSLLPIFIPIKVAKLSSKLRDMIAISLIEQENFKVLDFSTNFKDFGTGSQEVNFIIDLLTKLQKRYKNEELYNLLANHNKQENDQFCWDNIKLLRKELYFFCKKFNYEKSVVLHNLSIICKELKLTALDYFFSELVPVVTEEKLNINRNNLLKNFWAIIPNDLKPLIASNILSEKDKKFLIKKSINLNLHLQIYEDEILDIFMDDSYLCTINGTEELTIFKNLNCSHISFPIDFCPIKRIKDGYFSFNKLELNKFIYLNNIIYIYNGFETKSIYLIDIQNNNRQEIILSKLIDLLPEQFKIDSKEKFLSIKELALNRSSGDLIILAKIKTHPICHLFSYSFTTQSLRYLAKESKLFTLTGSCKGRKYDGLMATMSNDGSLAVEHDSKQFKIINFGTNTSLPLIIDGNAESIHTNTRLKDFARFSPDGTKFFLFYSFDSTISVFDVKTGKLLYKIPHVLCADINEFFFIRDNFLIHLETDYGADSDTDELDDHTRATWEYRFIDLDSGKLLFRLKISHPLKNVIYNQEAGLLFFSFEGEGDICFFKISSVFCLKKALENKWLTFEQLCLTHLIIEKAKSKNENKWHMLDDSSRQIINSIKNPENEKGVEATDLISILYDLCNQDKLINSIYTI